MLLLTVRVLVEQPTISSEATTIVQRSIKIATENEPNPMVELTPRLLHKTSLLCTQETAYPAQSYLFSDWSPNPQRSAPAKKNTCVWAVSGDSADDPSRGVEVPGQPIADVNLILPNMIMTVSDLVAGYNNTSAGLPELRQLQDGTVKISLWLVPRDKLKRYTLLVGGVRAPVQCRHLKQFYNPRLPEAPRNGRTFSYFEIKK